MLNIFKLKKKKFKKIKNIKNLKKKKIKKYFWIDLINPTKLERIYIKKIFNQKIINNLELFNIESSARFFEDKNGLHIHSFFFEKNKENYMNIYTVAFTLKNNKLYSLREKRLTIFNIYESKMINKKIKYKNIYNLILDLFEIKIEQLANEIEIISNELENLTSIILRDKNNYEFNISILILSKKENITSKIRICLIDTQRALKFLIRKINFNDIQKKITKEIIIDIESLLSYNESLFQKINFLIQAAMGFLNIEQNNILKIFSIISVIFLPSTLIASIYGMNFKYIPELNWHYGYPITIAIIFLSGLIPYTYFKIRKWVWIKNNNKINKTINF